MANPIGVKTEDGLLEFIHREIMVRCLPTSIPRRSASISPACISDQSIKVENLPKSDAYQFISPANTVICAVAAKAKEEVVAVPEVAAATEAAVEGAAAPAADAAAGKAAAPAKGCRRGRDKAAAPGKDKAAAPAKGKDKKEG